MNINLIAVCVSRAAMGRTAERQFRDRARRALEAGEPYTARGAKNKAILEEVRKEVARARKEVQAAAHAGQEAVRRQTRKGKGEIQEATTQGKRELENVVQDAAKRFGQRATGGARRAGQQARSLTHETLAQVQGSSGEQGVLHLCLRPG